MWFFFVPASLKFSGNVFFILLLLMLTVSNDSLIAASFALFGGQLLFLLCFSAKTGVRLERPKGLFNKNARRDLSLFIIPISSVLLGQLIVIVERGFASLLDPGSISIISYSARLYTGLVNLIGGALFGTALPVLSEMAARGKTEDIKTVVRMNVKIIVMLCAPLIVLLVSFSAPVLTIFFHKSALAPDQVLKMSQIIALYALGLMFSVAVPLGTALISSLSVHRYILLNSVIFISVNIFINLLLIDDYAIRSLPVARLLGNLSVIVSVFFVIRRRIRDLIDRALLLFCGKILFASGIMYLGIRCMNAFLTDRLAIRLIWQKLLLVITFALLSLMLFYMVCRLVKVGELSRVFQRPKKGL